MEVQFKHSKKEKERKSMYSSVHFLANRQKGNSVTGTNTFNNFAIKILHLQI